MPAAATRHPDSDHVASGPAAAVPSAKPVILRLAPVVNTWARRCSGASRLRTVNRPVSWGPSLSPATAAATRTSSARVLLAHGEREPLGLAEEGVRRMREGAERLREVFAAGTVEEAAHVLNDLLERYAHPPRLTTHGGRYPWHLHVDAHDDAPWADWFVASSCLALATLLADRQRPPGGLCASPSCGRPFVHVGGGSPRRYCTPRCATRERVAAHRTRSADAVR